MRGKEREARRKEEGEEYEEREQKLINTKIMEKERIIRREVGDGGGNERKGRHKLKQRGIEKKHWKMKQK